MIGVVIAFGASVLASVAGSGELQVTVEFPRIEVAIYSGMQGVKFETEAGKSAYTLEDVSDLERIIGKEIVLAHMDNTRIDGNPGFCNWNDEEFEITGIEIAGGESVSILAQ